LVKQVFIFLILLFSLSSCFSPSHSEGVVIDQNTSLPIDSAQITFLELYTVYTDTQGQYEIFGNWGLLTDLEILVERKGYKTKYINISESNYDLSKKVTIKLQAFSKEYKPMLAQNKLRFINTLIKIVFSLINAVTLIFILFQSKISRKFLWITGIMLINPAFRLLNVDYTLLNFEILNGPFYLFNYYNFPYSLIIAIPAISIVFWILFLVRRNWILEKNQFPELIKE
jgi:hypothetical protein